ncbi:hypothetical protein SYNPS1DRAFT_30684 [Syncephalis pseudoplumigaleata]|uniref:FAS1 domain-containing protein n=1 Tax=Syncephalis pseudoplumigaleata TaxID=1712513 RepID=A0A4P9YWA8_9FUNG|nr:hypothetical protein SYNPS1DRAFT_30684 [Syncephalis pseudoplumigaleata]|eukprot:RKP23561.1 hypothetical protein SYNPS1DRAFT_30684 [Syncephalis pseudoplumigaleata]
MRGALCVAILLPALLDAPHDDAYLRGKVAATAIVPSVSISIRDGHRMAVKTSSQHRHAASHWVDGKRRMPPIEAKGPLPGTPFVRMFDWSPRLRFPRSFYGPPPRAANTIGTVIAEQPQFTQLSNYTMIYATYSYLYVDPSQKLTLFAPTNTAFDRLSPNARRLLLNRDLASMDFMAFTIAAHLVPTIIPSDAIRPGQTYDVPTLAGVSLSIARPSNDTGHGHIRVEDGNVVGEPMVTQNGIIYPIDAFADPLADLNLSFNDVSARMLEDIFHFSSYAYTNNNNNDNNSTDAAS